MLSRWLARVEDPAKEQHLQRLYLREKNDRCVKTGLMLALYVLLATFVSATVWVMDHYNVPVMPLIGEPIPVAGEQPSSDCADPSDQLLTALDARSSAVSGCPDDA